MAEVIFHGGVRLRKEAAEEFLGLLEEGGADKVEEALGFYPNFLPLGAERELKEGVLPGFNLFEGSDLDRFLKWVAKAAEPGEVVALEYEEGIGYPVFGYQVVGDGTLKRLTTAFVDEEGRVLKTFPHPEEE